MNMHIWSQLISQKTWTFLPLAYITFIWHIKLLLIGRLATKRLLMHTRIRQKKKSAIWGEEI